jgi:hypothetical protein
MKTRFNSLIQSPDANEGTLTNSNYSTERTPKTALLFEAKRTVVLPFLRLEGKLPSVEILPEATSRAGCSVQE